MSRIQPAFPAGEDFAALDQSTASNSASAGSWRTVRRSRSGSAS